MLFRVIWLLFSSSCSISVLDATIFAFSRIGAGITKAKDFTLADLDPTLYG
jgi:hypothetical protein